MLHVEEDCLKKDSQHFPVQYVTMLSGDAATVENKVLSTRAPNAGSEGHKKKLEGLYGRSSSTYKGYAQRSIRG